MNYEKAYKEALERAKGIHSFSSDLAEIKRMEEIFPELKESEDERIREAQLDYWRSVGGKEWHGVPVQETIAWLEKQGEKAIISHKFNAGDWIVSKWGGIYQIKEVMSGSYNLLCTNNAEEINSITQVDNNSRLLCIGDIKKLEKQGETALEAIHIVSNPQVVCPYCKNTNCAYVDGHWFCPDCHREFQKPKWTGEDDRICYSLLADIKARQKDSTSTLEAYYNEQINWLKSLKERMQ